MKRIFAFVYLLFVAMSCSVTESIVFNENMGGTFTTTFDMSQLLMFADSKDDTSDTKEKKPAEVVDTVIVFNQFLEQYKDSISSLPAEEQKMLLAMKDVEIDIQMDENNDVLNFTMNKTFASFDELMHINEQLETTMNLVQDISEKDQEMPQGQIDDLTRSDPIIFNFSNNTFTRSQHKEPEVTKQDIQEVDGEDALDGEGMADMMTNQFEELFMATFYTMTYTFPKPIKSVSNKEAVISEDGRTMTLKTDLNAINSDPELMNLKVILED